MLRRILKKTHPKIKQGLHRIITKINCDIPWRFNGIKLLLNPAKNNFEFMLMRDGTYEPHVTKLIKELIKPGDIFVDIGSNIGIHSITAAKLGAQVYSFDPIEYCATKIRKLAKMNGVTITHRQIALSDKAGKVSFFQSTHKLGQSSISEQGNRTIEAKRLDSLLKKNIKLVKIDVEGHELQVIRGMTNLLKQDRIKYIIVEVRKGKTDDTILKLLKTQGFKGKTLTKSDTYDMLFTHA